MENAPPASDNPALSQLIAEAKASGGSERANYQLIISGLCRDVELDSVRYRATHAL